MYFEILRGILFEHASVYRAVTVEEYRERIVSRALHEAEYARLCALWSRAARMVDPRLMAITPEIYEFLEMMGILTASYSEWEVTDEKDDNYCRTPHPAIIRP
jgi:hypothetical protein